MLEKLIKLQGVLLALMALPDDQRDKPALGKAMHDYEAFIGGDEFKDGAAGYAATEQLKAEVAELKKSLDAEAEARRRIERSGLGLAGGRIKIPGGRQARREMLADQRGFMDDESARRFGAHIAVLLGKTDQRIDRLIPRYTREVAESVAKDAESFRSDGKGDREKATPDIDPGVSGSGAELISNEFRAELIRNVEVYGTIFTECRRVPLTTFGATTWPTRTSGQTAYWTSVGATIAQSGIGFGTVSLTPETAAVLTAIPIQMFRDPGLLADLGQMMGVEIPYAMGYAFDNAVVNGDGTGTYGGITGLLQSATLAAVTTAAHTTLSTLDGDDMDDFAAGLSGGQYHPNAKWFNSLSVTMKLAGIKHSTGGYLYRQPNARVADGMVINGYPAVVGQLFTAAASVTAGTKIGAFGDLRMAMYFGMVRSIEIAASDHVWFDQGLVAFRGMAFADAAEADASAVVIPKLHA